MLSRIFAKIINDIFVDDNDKLISLNFFNPPEDDYPKIKDHDNPDKYNDKYDMIYFKGKINTNYTNNIRITNISSKIEDRQNLKIYINKKKNQNIPFLWTNNNNDIIEFNNINFDNNNNYIDIISNRYTQAELTFFFNNLKKKDIWFYTFRQKKINFSKGDMFFILPAFIEKGDIKDKDESKKFIEGKESNKTSLELRKSNVFSQTINLSKFKSTNTIKVLHSNLNYILPHSINNPYIIFHNYNNNTFKLILPNFPREFKEHEVNNTLIKYKDKPNLMNIYCKWKNEKELISTISRTIKRGIIIINNKEYYIKQTQNLIEILEVKIFSISRQSKVINNEIKTNSKIVKCFYFLKDNSEEWYIYS